VSGTVTSGMVWTLCWDTTMSGAALRAGVNGKNLTEWQFGLGPIKPRWNVSGTYMQAIDRAYLDVSEDVRSG
jgi:hypothetical protein